MKSILETFGYIKHLGVGEIQTDEEMMIVPLIGDGIGDIAPPSALEFRSTRSYGTMEYVNTGDKPAIVPTNMMVRGKNAQDHAMSGSGVVLAASSRLFDNACCIESSQGGFFYGQEIEEDILPVDLRRALLGFNERSKKSYDKLWGNIRTWLSGLSRTKNKASHRAHLRDFFDDPDYKDELESFAAAFEPVEGQIGAVILFNGIPVGLEIMPSQEHWLAYWKWLVRGCYGSELIRLKEMNAVSRSTMVLPKIPVDADPMKVKEVITQFIDNVKMSIAPMLDAIKVTDEKQVDTQGPLITTLIRTSNGGGDVITQDSKPVYLSIIL